MSDTTTQADDRPAIVDRYVTELRYGLELLGGLEGIRGLALDGDASRHRTTLARAARGAIQHAGGDPLVVGPDRIVPYGEALEDGDLVETARELGAEVLAALAFGRARRKAREALELVAVAAPHTFPSAWAPRKDPDGTILDEYVEKVAAVIMRRDEAEAGR